jgi:xanthine dehydrogenase accessory factor
MNYSFPKILEALAEGAEKGLVLATLVEAAGSTPQVPGASAIFGAAGLVAGTVGGGLLEARVEAIAGEARRDGRARLVAIRLDADPSDAEGAICGGAATVLVDPGVDAARGVFQSALDGLRGRLAGALVCRIVEVRGDRVTVERGWVPAGGPAAKNGPIGGDIAPEVLDRVLQSGRPLLVRSDGRLTYVEPIAPLPRLIVAGAGHVGRAVARLGRLLDFSVTVVDDRAEYANAENIPEADEIVVGAIGTEMGRIDAPDGYFVIVTRGHAKDAEALRAVVRREAAYLGMIGSRTKIGIMQREFLEKGWATAEEWARVHAPIGLEIGSKTVEEIAVSISAELVQVRAGRRKKAGA